MFEGKTLGVIGAGNMAEALLSGVLNAGLLRPEAILASDPSPERRAVFAAKGCRTGTDNRAVAACDIILLSVKPQVMLGMLKEIGDLFGPQKLVITIAAGLRAATIASVLKTGTRIIRVMPNTPMLAGAGMSGVARGPNATDDDLRLALTMFGSAGEALEVGEELLDAVTAVSGSGPAYVFFLTELLAGAGRKVGLSPEQAEKFARQTVIGSARLLAQSDEAAAELRRKVTSPHGTTEAALKSFVADGLEATVERAVQAARDRSVELSAGA